MGRKWNPADHPRDGRGRFSHGGAASWAGKIGDKIGAKRGEDAGAERKKRDDYNQEILSEGNEFLIANEDDNIGDREEQDVDLANLLDELELAQHKGNHDEADRLADETRRYLIANGYTDDNDLPKWSQKVSDRLPAADTGGDRSMAEAFGPGVDTADGGEGTAQMISERIEVLRDGYEVQNPATGEWERIDDAYESTEHLTDEDIEDGVTGYVDISTADDHFTAAMDEGLMVRKLDPDRPNTRVKPANPDKWLADNGGKETLDRLFQATRDDAKRPEAQELMMAIRMAAQDGDKARLDQHLRRARALLG